MALVPIGDVPSQHEGTRLWDGSDHLPYLRLTLPLNQLEVLVTEASVAVDVQRAELLYKGANLVPLDNIQLDAHGEHKLQLR